MVITFPSDTRQTINSIRNVIGRPINFMTEVKTPCSACSIDPVTDTSTNSWCLVCSGVGYTIVYSGDTILAHITQGQTEHMQWSTGGQYIDGDIRAQIEYTPGNITVLDHAAYVMVDGKPYDIRKRILRGAKDLNRILVDCIEKTIQK